MVAASCFFLLTSGFFVSVCKASGVLGGFNDAVTWCCCSPVPAVLFALGTVQQITTIRY